MLSQRSVKDAYSSVGGLNKQIDEIRDLLEIPLTRPDLFRYFGERGKENSSSNNRLKIKTIRTQAPERYSSSWPARNRENTLGSCYRFLNSFISARYQRPRALLRLPW